MNLEEELNQWGPEACKRRGDPPSLEESRQYCRHLARSHYENFVVVGFFTPPLLRPAFEAVYAYCRWADDLGDETGDSEQSLALLDWWDTQLTELYAASGSNPMHPVFVALKPVIEQFEIPDTPFRDLLAAFRQDQAVTRYTTFADLQGYCRKSADPVGELVLRLFGQATSENLELSGRICSGLQLANFWQDVTRDYEKGRIYIPQAVMTQFHVDEADIAERNPTEAFCSMMAELVSRTRDMFDQGRPLQARLPGRVGLAIRLFHAGGVETLNAIAKQKYDVLTRRPRIGKMTQSRLMFQILVRSVCGA